jgi:signal transduction histidine kinase
MFSSRVAHDLKGPLGTVALLAESGTRVGNAEPQTRSIFDRITHQVMRMNTMMDALLEFARAGARPGREVHASIRLVIEQVIEEIRPAAHEARVDVQIAAADDTAVACSPGAISIVLSNLLRNALKYMDGGPARQITVRATRQHGRAVIEVQDTGRGLPAGSERIVFDPYVRKVGDEGPPGFGLGLATVKRIVEAYGGSVGVRSQLRRGSCFWFSLPLAPAPHSSEARSA